MSHQIPIRAFHAMAKPSGSECNLNCTYCFYLEKQALYSDAGTCSRMNDATLDALHQKLYCCR